MLLFDIAHNSDGHIYGTTDGSSESYFGQLKQGTLGNADPAGFIFKIGVDTSGNNNSSVVDFALEHNTFTVFPNPAANQITISFNELVDDSYVVSLRNAFGQLVEEIKPNSQEVSFDLTNLMSGLYLVNVSNSEGTRTLKLIKE